MSFGSHYHTRSSRTGKIEFVWNLANLSLQIQKPFLNGLSGVIYLGVLSEDAAAACFRKKAAKFFLTPLVNSKV
jgi:hypothetical protein